MPELPEVETIRQQLSAYLPLTIEAVKTSSLLKPGVLKTKLDIKGKTIVEIRRKGKMMDFVLDDGSHLLSHLGMTGTWLAGETIKPTKHTHLTLVGSNFTIAYDDPRRFGKLYYYSAKDAQKALDKLGLDLADPGFDLAYLTQAVKRFPERALKVALLDQSLFAGSGNYIACEICARAGIRPTRKCKNVKKDELPKILDAIHAVIRPAIASGGTTFQGGYRDTSGEAGEGLDHLVVFWQKICQMCKVTPVKKIVLAQRGTHFCPKCQR